MLHILCCVPVSSADSGQSDTCPHLCSSLSAFPGTSGLITRLLNNPCFNLCQLKKWVINIYLFREHFWTRLMKRHPFDLVALLLLQSSTLTSHAGLQALGSWELVLHVMTWEKKTLRRSFYVTCHSVVSAIQHQTSIFSEHLFAKENTYRTPSFFPWCSSFALAGLWPSEMV